MNERRPPPTKRHRRDPTPLGTFSIPLLPTSTYPILKLIVILFSLIQSYHNSNGHHDPPTTIMVHSPIVAPTPLTKTIP